MVQFAGGSKCGIELVVPRFPVGVIAAEEMGEVLYLGLAEGTGLRGDGTVPVGDFGVGKNVVTQFD